MGQLDGKVAFITGAARGQGRAHALALAAEGADVFGIDVCADVDTVPYPMGTEDELAQTQRLVRDLGRRCETRVVDIRDAAALGSAVTAMIETYGRVDICVANAAVCAFGKTWELSDDQWNTVVETNLTGTFKTLRAVVPQLIKQGAGGRIVAISSGAGRIGVPNLSHYVASKWGLTGLVKSLALEVAEYGITVNAICPATVDTPMVHNDAFYGLFAPDVANPTREQVKDSYAAMNPMRVPWMDVSDIANAVLYLVSDGARYVNGTTLEVSAGGSALKP